MTVSVMYYLSDEQLKEYCGQYVERNRFFAEKFREYNIPAYDTSADREEVLNDIVDHQGALDGICYEQGYSPSHNQLIRITFAE